MTKMEIANIKLENLQRTSKNWDGRTKEILLSCGGSGNMFGGSGKYLHIVLHGENSVKETGLITVKGVIINSYSIARGANGDHSQTVHYYKGESVEEGQKPSYSVDVKGSCGGGVEALKSILSLESDYLIK